MNTATTKPSNPTMTDDELLALATTYIAMRNVLLERGTLLATVLEKRAGKTLIVYDGEHHYELSRNYSPGRYELPVGVASAEVLGAK